MAPFYCGVRDLVMFYDFGCSASRLARTELLLASIRILCEEELMNHSKSFRNLSAHLSFALRNGE